MNFESGLSRLSQRTTPPPISWLMSMTLARPELISLAAGFTDSETLPVKTSRKLLAKILAGQRAKEALQYGSTIGLPRLRALTAERVRKLDNASIKSNTYSAERTIITNGSQQLLYIISEALCDPGDIVLVEDPTYFVYLGIIQSHGLRARGVRMEHDGLDISHFKEVLESLKKGGQIPKLKLIYLVSYYQNPTGITTSVEKKKRVLQILREYEPAAGHPLYLIEDAAYRELSFTIESPPSALSLGTKDTRVIYAGTYSKPFATGIRVGFGLVPEALCEPILNIKGNHDFGSTNLLQHLLADALSSGEYERHLATLRASYSEKAKTLTEALRRYAAGNLDWIEPQGGLYVWARLLNNASSGLKSSFFQQALKQAVLYVPGELCYADDKTRPKPDRELRISFGAASPKQIWEGVKRLASAHNLAQTKRSLWIE